MTVPAAVGAGLSDADFERFRTYFYSSTGIQFTVAKRYFVDKRVETCIQSGGFRNFSSWFAALRVGSQGLLQELINQLTVNETYFLREDYQFDSMLSTVLPKVLEARGGVARMDGPLKILSLPCSTGEEPYSIALRLLEEWDQIGNVNVEIHGGDIDSDVLARAAAGIFGERSLQRVPQQWRKKYFTALGEGRYQFDAELRRVIALHNVNVCDTPALRAFRDFDVIFCRNVLIYFDEVSSRRAAENLYGALRPGGYLFLGHSESMSRISPIFTPVRLPDGFVYQRPTGDK